MFEVLTNNGGGSVRGGVNFVCPLFKQWFWDGILEFMGIEEELSCGIRGMGG